MHNLPVAIECSATGMRIDVQEGRIANVKIYGDFFAKNDIAEIEVLLKGVRYNKQDITEAMKDFHIAEYFGGLSKDEFLELVY